MKFLILGCNGMAGHMIATYLSEKGYDVTGVARKESQYCKTVICDVKNKELLKDIIVGGGYDTVVNCVGILNQYAEANHALAVYINGFLPHFLADITSNTSTQIIQMSTDCVFSGERGKYTENDFPDGKTFYDRTKALGELKDDKNVTFRASIVGPDINENGIGLLNWFLNQSDTVSGYTKAIWSGQTTLQYAQMVEKAAVERPVGLFNMVPEEEISKYELLKLFNKYLRKNEIEIVPSDKITVDKSLKRTNYDFSYVIPDYEKMVAELAKWMKTHRNMYPFYDIKE